MRIQNAYGAARRAARYSRRIMSSLGHCGAACRLCVSHATAESLTVPRKLIRPVKVKRKPLTRERFAAGRAARYAEQSTNVTPTIRLSTSVLCPGCLKGHGVVIGTRARRTLLECDYCLRQFFPNAMERP